MGRYRAFTIRVCRECGLPVHADDCRFTGPLTDAPAEEVEVVPATEHQGAVEALRELYAAGLDLADLIGSDDDFRRWELAMDAARPIVGGR